MVRTVGFAVLAIAAAAVMFVLAPDVEPADASRFDRLITQALEDAESNETLAQGAPQQQVVNGWVARDLLTVIAQQNTAALETSQSPDTRIPALLLIVALAVCWHGATLPRPPVSPAPAGRDAGTPSVSARPEPAAPSGATGNDPTVPSA